MLLSHFRVCLANAEMAKESKQLVDLRETEIVALLKSSWLYFFPSFFGSVALSKTETEIWFLDKEEDERDLILRLQSKLDKRISSVSGKYILKSSVIFISSAFV